MKLIIAGGRNLHVTPEFIEETLTKLNLAPVEVVSGGAKGIDRCGEVYAYLYKKEVKIFDANWEKYGPRAGPLRNDKMAWYADALLLFWDTKSVGSADMKKKMLKRQKPVYEAIIK